MKGKSDFLINKTYQAKNQTNYWNQITFLRQFVNDEMISECFELIDSDDLKYKRIGIDILCQLGQNRKIFIKKLFEKIFVIFETTLDEKLICTGLFAIGHNNKHLKFNQIKFLEKFINSKSKNIRYALTFSLHGIEHDKAIKMLIKLANDRSPRIKDWATFGLGSQIKIDNEEIRSLLYKNCFSNDDQTKQEAIKGLANRKDERVKEIVFHELQHGNFGGLLFDTILNIKNGEEYISYLIVIYDKFKNDKSTNEQWLSDLKNCIDVLKK